MYNDLYEEAYNEGYMQSYLNEDNYFTDAQKYVIQDMDEKLKNLDDKIKKLEEESKKAKERAQKAREESERLNKEHEEKQERARQKQQNKAQNTNNQKKGLSKGAKIGIGAGVGAAAIGTGLAAYKLIKSNKKKKQAYEEYKRKGGKADYKTFKKTIMKECYEVLFENYDIILEMGLPLNDYDYMVLDEIYEDNLYDDYEEDYDYEDIYNEGYEAAILTESIFDEKGYTKYVAKCKAKGKTPLPFKQWKRNNILKTVGASTAAIGLTAGGLKVGSDYKNYKVGKEEIEPGSSKGYGRAVIDNDGKNLGTLLNKDFTNKDLINLGRFLRYGEKNNKNKTDKAYNKFSKHAVKNKNFIPSDK